MQIFRRLLKSKFGGVFALGFLALIAFTFVASDMSGSGVNLGGGSSAQIAKIGNYSLTSTELQGRAQMVFDRERQQNPQLTIDQFLAAGGLSRIADELIASRAMIAFGEKHGIRVSKALIDAQIASNTSFVDATGNFSETVFRQVLAQQRIPEQELRDDIAAQIIRQQLLQPVGVGARAPAGMVPPYAAMLVEERTGEMFAVPSATFAPTAPATDAQLQAFFKENASQYAIPEQRRLRYALINMSSFAGKATPTDAEIAELYKSRSAQFAARQVRVVSQLILATEAAARDAAAKAGQSQSMSDVAKGLGLSATRFDGLDQAQLATQTGAEIAKSAFAAAPGAVVGPVRSAAGWAVLRVDAVREVAGKTVEQAREELAPEVKLTKERQLFSELLSDIDGKLGEGASLTEIAKDHNLTLTETPLILSNGQALRDPAFKPDEALSTLLEGGFAARPDDEAQIVQVKADEVAALLSVSEVVPAGPPPFADIKPAIEAGWKLAQGVEKARQVATQLSAELGKGGDTSAVLAKLGLAGAPRDTITARRGDISGQGERTPPPMEALFSLRAGANRVVPLENNQGFIVVKLDNIKQNDPAETPQLIQSTAAGLSNVLGGEYAIQFLAAIQKELGITRNQAAIAAVEQELRRTYSTAE